MFGRRNALVTILTAIVILTLALFWYEWKAGAQGPKQPIPFSHRFHVGTKDLSCFMCHPGAVDSERSGIPPLETCMLCHSKIIIDHPQIVKLRRLYDERKSVEWVRVNDLPDFVYFDHSIHLHRGIDCSRCHGDVSGMDRVTLEHSFEMGFCVECHRDYGVTHDCFACHR